MSNCHEDFIKFNRSISLNTNELKKLERSRDAIKSRIVNYFKSKRYKTPEFRGQGSFSMGTGIRPLEGYYDLDMGIYLHGLGTDSDNWPVTETIHSLIYKAVEGHTTTKPVSKSTCIRVIYKSPYLDKGDISYHIDLTVYAFEESFWSGRKTVIGFKGDKQWSESSDPQKFTEWFFKQCNLNSRDPDQLKRIVKYLKAWKENQPSYPKMPSGMILTVLAAKNFKPNLRDDIAFIETVAEFYDLIGWSFSIKKPTEPFNNLAYLMSDAEDGNFMDRLDKLVEIGKKAVESSGRRQSLEYWNRIFGKQFTITTPVKLISQ